MRKTLTAALAACCAVCGAKDCADGKSAYEGFYVGAGLSYQNSMHDVKVSDNLGDTSAKFIKTMDPSLTKEQADALAKNSKLVNVINQGLNRKNVGKVGASVSVGYGQFVYSNLYLGADFSLDISKKGKSVESDRFYRAGTTYGDTTVQNNAVVPTLALKVGGYIPDIDTLVCIRAGAAKTGIKAQNELLGNEIKFSKITPVVGLSIEKNVGKSCSIKLEGNYRFPISKQIENLTDNLVAAGANKIPVPVPFRETVKTKGYSVRLMYVYHF